MTDLQQNCANVQRGPNMMPASMFAALALVFLAGVRALAPLDEDFGEMDGENMMVPSDGAASIAPVDGGAYGTYSWAPIANLTQPRLDFAAAVVGTTVYVAGGVGPLWLGSREPSGLGVTRVGPRWLLYGDFATRLSR